MANNTSFVGLVGQGHRPLSVGIHIIRYSGRGNRLDTQACGDPDITKQGREAPVSMPFCPRSAKPLAKASDRLMYIWEMTPDATGFLSLSNRVMEVLPPVIAELEAILSSSSLKGSAPLAFQNSLSGLVVLHVDPARDCWVSLMVKP